MSPIDPVLLALSIGANVSCAQYVRGDKEHSKILILKAALSHRGFALVDADSPCAFV